MKQSIVRPQRTLPARRRLALALLVATMFAAAAPAWAGDVCEHVDGTESSTATGTGSSFACGFINDASGHESTALGTRNTASGSHSSAIGHQNRATGAWSSAFGKDNQAYGEYSVAIGGTNTVAAEARFGVAMGAYTQVSQVNTYGGVAMGFAALATGLNSTALGSSSIAPVTGATAVGREVRADGENSTVLGFQSDAKGAASTVIGSQAMAEGDNSTALGQGSVAQANNSVALGQGSVANRANTISVGGADHERQIVNVAAGTEATDAVNLSQLQGVAAEAKTYTDAQVASVRTAATTAATANAKTYTDTRETAVRSDMTAGDATTLQNAKAYSDNTATQTLTAANAYTDNRITELVGMADDFGAFQQHVDDRFAGVDRKLRVQDRRIDKQGAMSSAMLNMANSGNGLAGNNRIGVGVGSQGGETALAVGYQRVVNQRFGISLGGAFSGDDKSVGGGASLSW